MRCLKCFLCLAILPLGILRIAIAEDGPASIGGRPLSWDNVGIVPLNAEGALSKADKALIDDLKAAELGRAESKARQLLSHKNGTFVSAWVLVQCTRVKKTEKLLYDEVTAPKALTGLAPEIAVYLRYQSIRLLLGTEGYYLPHKPSGPLLPNPAHVYLSKQLADARTACRPLAPSYLPIAVALMQGPETPILDQRAVIEEYKQRHPTGPDVRLLLCRAYLSGAIYGKKSFQLGRPVLEGIFPDEFQPSKAVEICKQLLKENKSTVFAHYYLGRAFYDLQKDKEAISEIKLVVDDPKAPATILQAANRFLARPRFSAFYTNLVD